MIQFTAYDEQGSHYDWHMDCGEGNLSRRKLSMTIQLSDPEGYSGGNLELLYGRHPVTVERKRGTLVAFPSYTLHRVTPVTAGVRYSLVLWISGASPYK
jgi:PKHD-type hydroxylase